MYYKKLVGDKVYLSPMSSKHYEKYTVWLNSGRVSVGLASVHKVWTETVEKKVLQQMELENNDKGKGFAIVKLDSNEPIGNCGLFSINSVNRSAEVGIFIGDEVNRGSGLGTDHWLCFLILPLTI